MFFIFFLLGVGEGESEAPWGGRYTREMGTHLSFWRFFSCLIVFFASKLSIFPFKTCFGSLKRPFSGPKRTNGGFGVPRPQTPKPPEMPIKLGKRHNTTIGLATWIGLKSGQKLLSNRGKKRQKDKWCLIRAPTRDGFIENSRGGGGRGFQEGAGGWESICGELGNFLGGGC